MAEGNPIQADLFGAPETASRKGISPCCHKCKGPIDRPGSNRCSKCFVGNRCKAAQEAGLCWVCRVVPATDGYRSCEACRARHTAKALARRKTLRDRGVCVVCRAAPVKDGRTWCDGCSRKSSEAAKEKRRSAERFCSCGAGPLPLRFKKCKECSRKRFCAKALKYRNKLIEQGLCVICCKPYPDGVNCQACLLVLKARRDRLKRKCMDGYGGRCRCCGEEALDLLTLDHVHNDGSQKRRTGMYGGSGGGFAIYRWAIKNGFPADLQALCYNCNHAKRLNNGICPHVHDRLMRGDGQGI